jgi:hypothetical protein
MLLLFVVVVIVDRSETALPLSSSLRTCLSVCAICSNSLVVKPFSSDYLSLMLYEIYDNDYN